jgi:hypothetical protein
MNLYEKLVEIRKNVPYLQKVADGGQYKYVSNSQVVSAIRDLLDKHKVFLKTEILDQSIKEFHSAKGTIQFMTSVQMKFTWVNAEEPEEQIVTRWEGQGVDTGEKGIGKAATYAEKYFILKTFNIPTDKDDPDAHQSKVEKAKPPERVTDEQLALLRGSAENISMALGKDLQEVIEAFQINLVRTVPEFERVRFRMNKQLRAAKQERQQA